MIKILIPIGIFVSVLAGFFSPGKTSSLKKVAPVIPAPKHRFIVVAHRGLHNRLPENSVASFLAAARAGVDYVEMDLRTTKDSVLVLLHDATLDRTTTGSGAVSQTTYSELQKLTLKWNGDKDSARIPTFGQALDACRNRIYIYLDFKSASVRQTMTLIRSRKMEDQVIVYINSAAQYNEWREREPAMPLMLSLPDSVKSAASLKSFLVQYPAALLDGNYAGYNKSMLSEAATEQIAVWPDIQGKDEADHWQQAIDTGFIGLQTDHPEALIAWLKERGLR